MPSVLRARSESYLSFFTGLRTMRCATRAGQRGSTQFDNTLTRGPEPSLDFTAGRVATGARYTVQLADPSATQVLADWEISDPNGTNIEAELVTTVDYVDGSSAEQAYAISGKYISHSRTAKTLSIVFGDTDAELFDRVYPSALYTLTEFPNMDPSASSKPIGFPVGTALKFPCALLAQQTLWDGTLRQPEWLYGVCELEWQSYAITAVNTGAKTFGIAGDRTAQLNVGDSIWVFDTGSRSTVTNEGKYTVVSATFSAGTTTITVSETIGSATVACHVNIPPRVLNVYRNGRLVNKTEYTIEVLDNGAGAVPATVGDFSTGATDWSATGAGTGTATLSGGTANITGDGGAVNTGTISLQSGRGTGVQQRRHQYAPWQITCTGTGAAWLCDTTTGGVIAGNGSLVRAGSPARLLIRRGGNSSDLRCRVNTANAGATGTNLTFDNWSIEQPAKPLLMVRFTREQRDPSGALYTIEADVFGFRSRNVADEISRIISEVGGVADSTSFSAAASVATTEKMLADCAHGARGARKARAIVEDLLFIARGMVYRAYGSGYLIVQDITRSSVGTLNESQGDLIEVTQYNRDAYPAAVGIRYRPSGRDPSQMTITRKRVPNGAVVTGTNADAARDCEYLRDHDGADRLVWYLSERAYSGRRISGQLLLARPGIGDVYAVVAPVMPSALAQYSFHRIQHTVSGVRFEAVLNLANTYSLGTLPGDPVDIYEPDYSQTAPDAPTGLRITALAGGRASVDAIPPAVNWAELWFVITHNTNGQIMGLILGDYSTATGRASTIIGGLTAGQVYKLQAYAKNAFLIQGVLQSTFDATAIGGGAAVTTFTA